MRKPVDCAVDGDHEWAYYLDIMIDCDVHHSVPTLSALFPYLPDRWRDYCVEHGVPELAPSYYPAGSPLSARPGSDANLVRQHVLDDNRADHAILNCLYGIQIISNEDWAVAMARAVNDWQSDVWLSVDPRFRASIVVAPESPHRAAEEIERLAGHPGFVQVLLLLFSQMPFGKRFYWPIYEIAARYRLPVAIHPGVSGGNPLLPSGWPSYYIEDYAAAAPAFQSQLVSLVSEGVFQKFPGLRVVLLESGVSWLPSLMWRLDKNWKGLRREVPWLDRPPSSVVRDHVWLSVQPFDSEGDRDTALRVIEHIGSTDCLLYASDYPHWHYQDSNETLLQHLSEPERQKVLRKNAIDLYGLEVK